MELSKNTIILLKVAFDETVEETSIFESSNACFSRL